MHCTSKTLLTSVFGSSLRRSTLPPSFLIPSIYPPQSTPFSTTPTLSRQRKRTRDPNPNKFTSPLNRSGLGRKQTLSVKLENLPKPVLDASRRSTVDTDPDHGLWDFFNRDGARLYTPQELSEHGRAWTVPELRAKDWEDLWRLWWVCLKEKNRIGTFKREVERLGKMYGTYEGEQREDEIKKTQKAIKHCLTERWYAWENARSAAMEDSEIDLYAGQRGEKAYFPREVGEQTPSLEAAHDDNLGERPPSADIPPPLESPRPSSEARI